MNNLQYDVWIDGNLWMSLCYLPMAESVATRLRAEKPSAKVEVVAAPMNWHCR